MRFKMSKNSLFAILLRSNWWVSLVVALVIVLIARTIVPEVYSSYVVSFAFPFVIISMMAAWKQRNVPSSARVEETVTRLSAMNWREFSVLLEEAYQRDGYTVSRLDGAADFRLEKNKRVILVSAKRWKGASHGVPTLSELVALREKTAANEVRYVALNPVSEKGVLFAREHGVALVQGAELARLLQRGWLN